MKIETEFSVGDLVFDDLTGKVVKVIGISFSDGYTNGDLVNEKFRTIGYWIDSPYLSGGRHPWEISAFVKSCSTCAHADGGACTFDETVGEIGDKYVCKNHTI